jgi:DNA-directed RNA polymerase subunit N (RpoN/RPB10)
MSTSAERALAAEDKRHGTLSGYTNWDCRCQACTRANAKAQKRYRERLAAEPTPEHVHGTINGFDNYKCRCESCRNAKRAYDHARKCGAEA